MKCTLYSSLIYHLMMFYFNSALSMGEGFFSVQGLVLSPLMFWLNGRHGELLCLTESFKCTLVYSSIFLHSSLYGTITVYRLCRCASLNRRMQCYYYM